MSDDQPIPPMPMDGPPDEDTVVPPPAVPPPATTPPRAVPPGPTPPPPNPYWPAPGAGQRPPSASYGDGPPVVPGPPLAQTFGSPLTHPYGAPIAGAYGPPPGTAYGPPPPPYGGYGQTPGYGGGVAPAVPQISTNAIIGFVLALVNLTVCPILIPGIVALVLAHGAEKEIRHSGGWKTGTPFITATKWIAWIGIIGWGLYWAFLICIVFLAVISGPSSDPDYSTSLAGVLQMLGVG